MASRRKPLGNKRIRNREKFADAIVKVNQHENFTKRGIVLDVQSPTNGENVVVAVAEKKDPQILRGVVRGRINSANGIAPAVVVTQQEVSYKISRLNVCKMFSKDQKFRKIIYEDKYCYIDGYYILKTPKAFVVDNGTLKPNINLPDFEKDYCLGIKRSTVRLKDYPRKPIVTFEYKHAEKSDEITIEEKKAYDQLMYLYLGTGGGGGGYEEDSFGMVLTKFMKKEKVNDLDMEERTGFSDRQIRRFRNGEQEPKTLEDIIVLSIALGLNGTFANLLLSAAGRRLRKNKKEMTYMFLLEIFSPRRDVVAANKFLIRMNMKPLNKKLK